MTISINGNVQNAGGVMVLKLWEIVSLFSMVLSAFMDGIKVISSTRWLHSR